MPNGSRSADPLRNDVRLADMLLSPSRQQLLGANGEPIAVERKAFDLLCHLVAQRERVVGKDELLRHVWGRSIASDTVIAQAVSKARRALQQGGGAAEWIDVVRGVGYRYVGPAEAMLSLTSKGVVVAPPRWKRGPALLVLALAVGALAGIVWQKQQALRDPLRVAVLPWRDDSGDEGLAWSTLGLQGLLVDALANDRRIEPLPQSQVRALLAARPELGDPAAQAEYLTAASGVAHVYAGRLLRENDGLVVELVLLGSEATQSSRVAGRSAVDLALAAGSEMTQRLLPGFDPHRPRPLSNVPFANEAYARGLDARLRGRGAEAIQHLRSALDADPQMLAALFQLSVAYQMQRDTAAWRTTLNDLLALADARGDRLYQGMALGGLGVLAWREGRYEEAEAQIRVSMDFFDSRADATRLAGARANLGSLAAIQGRFDEAEREMGAALALFEASGMQVETARVSKNLGVLEIDRARFEVGRRWLERSRELREALGLERDMADTLVSLGAADLSTESPAAAQASLARAAEIFAQHGDPLLESDALARLALAQIQQGQLTAAAESAGRSLASARSAGNAAALGLAHLRLATIAARRGDRDGALSELARSESAFADANDRKGLARIAIDRFALLESLDDEQLEALDSLLEHVREAGWRVLEAESLALRATLSRTRDARRELRQAYLLAVEIGEPALLTDIACRYAALPETEEDSDQVRALGRCMAAAARSASAARIEALRAEADDDAEGAARAWARARELAGEAWHGAQVGPTPSHRAECSSSAETPSCTGTEAAE